MSKANWLSFTAVIFLAVGIFTFGCNNPSNKQGGDSEALELRSYAVPQEYASEVSSIVNRLLDPSPGPSSEVALIGRARIGPGNMLLVTAPASIHSGIEKMLEDLKKSDFEPPKMVTLTYWLVVGRKANAPGRLDNLNEISPALSAIEDSEGSMDFSLKEKLKLQSLSGEGAVLSGQTVSIAQNLTVQGSRILGNLNIQYERARFETTIQTGPGKLLVLGQRGIEDPSSFINKRKNDNESSASLFYIVRASLE